MRARRVAAAALAGALIAVGGAPLELSFLSLLAPAALLYALEAREPVSSRLAIVLGLVTGFVTNAISMYWIVELLTEFGGFPTVLSLLLGSLLWMGQSLPYVFAAWLTAAALRAGGRGWLALPAALMVAESFAPAIFPWRPGLSQLPFLEYAQVAELGGLPLLDWLFATVGCGAFAAIRDRRRAPAIAAVLALALPPLYGAIRLPQVRAEREAAPALRIGVTQPNVSIEAKHDVRQFLAQLRLLQAQTRDLEAAGAELVIWPETAYRFPILRSATRDRDGLLAILGEGVRGPLIVGVISTAGPAYRYLALDESGRTVDTFVMADEESLNSAVAITPDGRFVGIADKVNPLAFGEYTPFWEFLPWRESIPRGITPGAGPQILEIAGARVGVLNCYEDLLAEHVRTQDAFAPNVWVNVTNNAWFGDTNAPHLHHMNARMRAIETRRDLVRSVNTGVSGHTASTGEDLARTGTFVPATFVAEARLLGGRTVYSRVGDWPAALGVGALLGFALARWRRRG